jgi:hypothetical protein
MQMENSDYRPSKYHLSNGEIQAVGLLAGGAVANICRELLALREAVRWKPITPESLPKVGVHEVIRKRLSDPRGTWIICDVADTPFDQPATYRQYRALGWTHYRASNPPTAEGSSE